MPPLNLHWKEGVLGTHHDFDLHIKTLDWIIENRKHFDRVILNYSISEEKFCYDTLPKDMKLEMVDVGAGKFLSAKTTLESLKDADIVISGNTAGYIALASGYPTLLFNNFKGVPTTCGTGGGYHWDMYKDKYEFPLTLLDMSADEVLALREKPNPLVESWKGWNIGASFDADKFISVIREFV